MKEVWPGYETIRLIGKGTYGSVYEVKKKDPSGEYFSAVKKISVPASEDEYETMQDSGYDDEEITAYFESRMQNIVSEFQLMEKFKGNTHIVSYEDHMVIEHDDKKGWDILIRMELLKSLTSQIKEHGNLSEQEVIQLGMDICEALELIQTQNIVHRDIKPQNILINRFGAYKLSDFGIARTMDHATKATMAGTPDYIAPEVYHKEEYGVQADQYSLGLVLFWALNERRLPFYPVKGKVTANLIEEAKIKRMSGEQIPAPAHGSKELAQVILKACAYDPDDRYKDIREFRNALISCKTNENQPVELSEPEVNEQDEDEFEESGTIGVFSVPVKQTEELSENNTPEDIKNTAEDEEINDDENEDFENSGTLGFFNVPKKEDNREPKQPPVRSKSAPKNSESAISRILEEKLPELAGTGQIYQLEYHLKPDISESVYSHAHQIMKVIPPRKAVLGILIAYDSGHNSKHAFVFTEKYIFFGSHEAETEISRLNSLPYKSIESVSYYGGAHKRLRIRKYHQKSTLILYLNGASASNTLTVCSPEKLKKLIESLIGTAQKNPDDESEYEKADGEDESVNEVLPEEADNSDLFDLCRKAITAQKKKKKKDADRYTAMAISQAHEEMFAIGLAYELGATLHVINQGTGITYGTNNTVHLHSQRGKPGIILFPKNTSRALEWLKKSAEINRDICSHILCALIYECEGSVRNYSSALSHIKKAKKSCHSLQSEQMNFIDQTLKRIESKYSGGSKRIAEILTEYHGYAEGFYNASKPEKVSLSDDDYRSLNIYHGLYVQEGLTEALDRRSDNGYPQADINKMKGFLNKDKVLCVYNSSMHDNSWIFTDKRLYLCPFKLQRKNTRNPAKNSKIEFWGANAHCISIMWHGIKDIGLYDKNTLIFHFNTDEKQYKNFTFWKDSVFNMSACSEMFEKIISVYKEVNTEYDLRNTVEELIRFYAIHQTDV